MPAKASSPAERAPGQVLERRKKERRGATGEVVLFLEDPHHLEIRGNLMNVSDDGFRAAHHHTALRPGQQVTFHHSLGEGIAQVMWNRVVGDRVESGFFIQERASP